MAEGTTLKNCKNDEHEYHYYPQTNEDGWRCVYCDDQPGEPPGFSPRLDRAQIYEKVGGILLDASSNDLISISNGSQGDYLTAKVADRCVRDRYFDQYSILAFILDELTPGHAMYWKEISEGIIAGADPRDRCHCGKLATGHSFSSAGKAAYCSWEHAPKEEAPF